MSNKYASHSKVSSAERIISALISDSLASEKGGTQYDLLDLFDDVHRGGPRSKELSEDLIVLFGDIIEDEQF